MPLINFCESLLIVCMSASFFFVLATFFLRIFCRNKGDWDSEAYLSVAQTVGHLALIVTIFAYFTVKGISFCVYGV